MRYGYKPTHKTRELLEAAFGILGGTLRLTRHFHGILGNEDITVVCANGVLDRFRLWSFADMIELRAVSLVQAVAQLAIIIQGLHEYPDMRGEMLAHAKEQIAQSAAWYWIEESGFPISDIDLIFRISGLRTQLNGNNPYSAEALVHQLEGIRNQLIVLLSGHKFAYIQPPNDAYFEQEQLFGGPVYELFPEARQEIKDAGNCIAASLYTASVFHLMRTCELGLRVLAKKVKVKLTHNRKPQPIDTATWDKIINKIRSNLDSAHNLSYNSPKRVEKIRLYADLLDRCVALKDLYRNDAMHMRGNYGYHDTVAVLERCKGFMQALCLM